MLALLEQRDHSGFTFYNGSGLLGLNIYELTHHKEGRPENG